MEIWIKQHIYDHLHINKLYMHLTASLPGTIQSFQQFFLILSMNTE